jgi:Tfp pilus assembly protein FimV
MPTQSMGTAPAPKRGGAATMIFIVLTVVFFLAAAGAGALYYTAKKSADKKIADQKAQIATMQHEAATKADELAQTKKDLDAAKGEAADGAACVSAVQAFFDAVNKNDQTAGTAAVLTVASKCKGVHITQ